MSDLVPEEALSAGREAFVRCGNGKSSTKAAIEAATPFILAAELERQAKQFEDRGRQRDQSGGEPEGSPCDGECDNGDCHRVSAVSTFFKTSGSLRLRAAELRST